MTKLELLEENASLKEAIERAMKILAALPYEDDFEDETDLEDE